MDNILIGEVNRSNEESICVQVGSYKGKEWVDVRIFFKDASGQMLPTKKGVTVPMDCLPALMQLLETARTERTVCHAKE